MSEATRTIREISQAITLLNPKVVARLTREAELGTINPSVFINLIDRGWGRPIPMGVEKPPNDGLYFIQYRTNDPMAEKCAQMNRDRDAELALQALQEGRPDLEAVIAATNGKAAPATPSKLPEDEETLESVRPGPADLSAVRDMLPPQRSQYERDRLPRDRE